ncbi:Putative GPI inositol-deacylase [Podospora comata]|uniref:GPI inositol-deacylase n=1 Tax=Podospora comata TaxID=48703 RepID=A0ABY6SGQ8_PODCO|nr:Putative GPI inositol-deacylase [Podospora comata]
MTRHSSGSSEDGDTLHVEVPHVSSSNQFALRPQAAAQPSTSTSPDSNASHHHQRRSSADPRTSSSISRRSTSINWKPTETRNGSLEKPPSPTRPTTPSPLGLIPTANGSHAKKRELEKAHEAMFAVRHQRWRSPWAIGLLALVASITGIALLLTVVHSSVTRQIDPKGCRMSYLRPSYAKLNEFDTEHTRLASKYSLYMYREQGIDHDTRVRGVPVLFIPGNAGSYKQVRPIASEAANYFHDVLQHDPETYNAGIRSLDFFTVDFNEDITAFHGQTLLDQAEYLNEAIRYILSLYLDPRVSDRNPDLPDPTSVIVLGHSMGGIVARTMLIMPNYQTNSINTIITMSAPHARPPVSFDSQIVKAYKDINDYWRHAYSQQWANNNPLWHVTLVSIAGGGLDTVVPSDYASVESLVPDTHGFTVFTSTIPTVWTSMDHQAILWCDQFRKVLVRTLFDLSDVHRASQTKPRAERMRVFKKRLLTGMETVAEKTAPRSDPTTLLTVEDNSDTIIAQGERLVLRQLGTTGRVRAHLMTIPPPGPPEVKRFTLMTDIKLDQPGENGKLEVMFCSVVPSQPGQTGAGFPSQIDLSKGTAGTTRLACRSAAPDVIPLPGSNKTTAFPFYRDLEKQVLPFYYLEYDLDDIAEQQFIAVVEKATNPTQGFVIAEFSEQSQSHQTAQIGLQRLLTSGLKFTMPAARPMVTEIKVPSLQSSLLAYNLRLSSHSCGNKEELFAPMVRQYLVEPFESKYFVNVRDAPISLHGVAPYVPPPLAKRSASEDGLSFQFWTDPTCDSSIEVELEVDFSGSLGKLYMRYRTVFAAFPLLVVALVLRKQFRVYDTTGVFITFTESLDLCLRQSIPLMLASLTMLTVATANPNPAGSASFWHWNKSTSSLVDFHLNDYLIGTQDPMFLFLIPMIGIICVGVCTVFNYITLALTHLLSSLFNLLAFRPAWVRNDERKKQGGAGFLPSSPRRRMITTAVLLFLVSTAIPYQFAYLVACLVQLTTTVRAQRIAQELQSAANSSFYNYVHSILILMLWILPINLPTLVVWIHNLAVHWLTPFTSHHNVLSIMPFIVLVETLTTGKMVPPVTGRMKHLTSILLFGIAIYAAVYGISYAYTLHHLVNLVAFWLVILHSTSDSWSISGLKHLYEGDAEDRKGGKEP